MSILTSPFMNYGRVDSDVSRLGQTAIPIPGLGFLIDPDQTYHFEATLIYQSSGTGGGIMLGLTGPASPALVMAQISLPSTGATAVQFAQIAAYNVLAGTNVVWLANTNFIGRMIGAIHNGPNTGTVQVVFASSSNTQSAIVKMDSVMRYNPVVLT